MSAEYYILLKDAAGNPVAQIDDFLELTYSKQVWSPGLLNFRLDGNSNKIALFQSDSQIEVYRRNPDFKIDWYCDFYGLFRKQIRETPDQQDYFHAYCPGQMTKLSWAHVMWQDKLDNRTRFTGVPAETIMKTLVAYNATSLATIANGRAVTWPFNDIKVQADQGRGPILDWKCAWKPLLEELQAIAKIANGDFDLVKTGPKSWEFRYYPQQLGTDRSGPGNIAFSLTNGNMASPKYTFDRINEATVAVVGGRGDAAARTFQIVYGTNYNASNNYNELFVHAADQDTDAYLTAKGQEAMYRAQARNQFSFRVLQTPSTQYGRDYFVGDIVTAYYKSLTFKQKVDGVTVNFKSGSGGGSANPETIEVSMKDV